MGPLILDCQQEMLQPEEKDMLEHPVTGGVILFTRNFYDVKQLAALIGDIRRAAKRPLLIAVDHEGGRVQRFRDGFTTLPAMGQLDTIAGNECDAALLAKACGVIMAYELKQLDIDISFAPVLDVDGISDVIGDRAFATQPQRVVSLAAALIDGMHAVNMPATGKHFPGHGSVKADSHIALPVDDRPLSAIIDHDMLVFKQLINNYKLDAIMPAHVIYSEVDPHPAGFSRYWIQQQLRESLAFNGVIFSDDLSMHGASVAGDYVARAEAALDAGCDMVLACNNPKGAASILDGLKQPNVINPRFSSLSGRRLPATATKEYAQASALWTSYAAKT